MKRLMTAVAPKASPQTRSSTQAQEQADRSWTLTRKLRGGRSFRSTMVVNQWGGELDLEILENIGEGSYGVVNRAVEKSTGQTRVVKRVVQPSHWDQNKLKEEAELLQSFDHPHIVRIFAWCVNTGSIEIVMEECKGGEYLSVIRKGKNRGEFLSESWIASAFLQVFEALAYVHGKGIVHRDLKSGNLLLLESTESENGSVFEKMPHMVVCDLGIATVYAEGFWSKCLENMSGVDLAGTPAYMAPELFKGKNATPKADIWSMGVLLYQTYTNRLPFTINGGGESGLDSDSQSAWYDCISKGVDWSKLRASNEVKKFCAKLLSFKDVARPNTLECIQDPWIRNNADQGPSTDEIRELMQALSFWKDKNSWQRAICLKLAVGCTCANRFARVFAMFDKDNSGVLSTPEIVKKLVDMGIGKHDAKTIAEHLDFNRDKTCEFLEFVAACLCSLREEFDQMLRALFSMLDTNDDGVIDEKEMLTLKRELEPIAKAHGFELGELDNDGDGVISFCEFASYFGRKGIRRSSVVLTTDDADLMRISTFMAKDVLARGRSTEEVARVLDRHIGRGSSAENSRSSHASSSSVVTREDQSTAIQTTYRGTFTHPSFGSNSVGIIVEITGNQATWTALGESKSQTDAIQILWNGKRVIMMDSTTQLTGELVSNGVIQGSVVQSGVPGGSFRLTEEKPSQVTKKKQDPGKSKRVQSQKKKKAKQPQFDFDNDALSKRILESMRQHRRQSKRESKPRGPNPLYDDSVSDTDVTSCPETASVVDGSSVALSDFDLTDLWGYDSFAPRNDDDNPLRQVTLGYDALPRYVSL